MMAGALAENQLRLRVEELCLACLRAQFATLCGAWATWLFFVCFPFFGVVWGLLVAAIVPGAWNCVGLSFPGPWKPQKCKRRARMAQVLAGEALYAFEAQEEGQLSLEAQAEPELWPPGQLVLKRRPHKAVL